MSFGEKKKIDASSKWSVQFMQEMNKSRGTNRTGDTFNKALFSLIKADIKEPSNSAAANNSDKAPKTARGVTNNSNISKIGNTNTPAPNSDVRADVPGDRRSRGLTRSFSLNEITALLAQPVPEEESRAPESDLAQVTSETSPVTRDTPSENSIPNTANDTCQTESSVSAAVSANQTSTPINDSGTTQSTPRPNSGITSSESETNNSALNDTTSSSASSPPDTASDTRQTADTTPTTDPVTRVKVPPLPVNPASPRSPRNRHRHTRSVGSSQALIEHALSSPRAKNSDAPTSPRDSISPHASPRNKSGTSPRNKSDTSPREIVNTTGAVIGASATDPHNGKDKHSATKDKKRTLKKRSSKRTRPPSTITSSAINSNANNGNLEESSDSPRSIKAITPNKGRRVSNSVSQIGNYRRGSISSDSVPYSPRARTLKHAPKIDASTIDATTQKLNLEYMDEVLVSIKEKLLFPSVKSDFTAEKLSQMPLSWVMQRMPLLRAKRDLAFKHHMHAKQLRTGKVPSPGLKKDHLLSNMTRWSSSDINKIRPGSSQSVSLTNTPVKTVSNNNLRHVRTSSGTQQRRVNSIQLIPASPRDNDPNKEIKSSPKSGEEVKQ